MGCDNVLYFFVSDISLFLVDYLSVVSTFQYLLGQFHQLGRYICFPPSVYIEVGSYALVSWSELALDS